LEIFGKTSEIKSVEENIEENVRNRPTEEIIFGKGVA